MLETTQNKDLKGSGGIIGLTLKGAALQWWYYARPVTASYSSYYEPERAGKKSQPSQDHKWDDDIRKMKQVFAEGSFINPFEVLNDAPKGLVNLAIRVMAPQATQISMLNALTNW